MDQTNHEHREPQTSPSDSDRPESRGRWSVWVPLALGCGVLVAVGGALVVTVLVVALSMDGPHDVSDHLGHMGGTMQDAVLGGATLHEALARAQDEGIGLTVAGAAVLINPDPKAWRSRRGLFKPRDAPTLLIADVRYEDCFLLPEGEGRAGYYGYTGTGELRFIPAGELPEWARP
ncbi:MAG: hypothetical protein NCW75_05280 [Phycisphaera sp.]|nr:MAG: hypothetical protein NCW75_05280 [Phycisphaera sp.]